MADLITAPLAPGIQGAAPVVAQVNNGGNQSVTPTPAPVAPVVAGTPVNNTVTLSPDLEEMAKRGLPTPAAASAPTSSSNDYYSRYSSSAPTGDPATDYLDTFTPPKTEDEIAQEKTQAAQGQIDAINKQYDSYLAEQATVNQGRDRGTNAISILNGLAGSSDAQNAATQTSQLNQQDNDKINAERGAQIAAILSKIRSDAVTEAQQSRTEARQSAEDVLAQRKALQDQSLAHLTNLAKTGVTADGLKATDPVSYAHLASQVGGEDQLKALFTLNIPKETIQSTSVVNGHYVVSYLNPLTGKVRLDSIDLGLPQGSVLVADTGGALLFGKAGADGKWDGDMSTTTKIDKSLSPDQQAQNKLAQQKQEAEGGYTTDEDGNVIQTGDYNALTIQRYNKASASATAILQKNPTFKAIVGASAYLDRIEAAVKTPGAVGDQELLDAFTQLDTGGQRVTEAQVHLVTQNQSLSDFLAKAVQQVQTGGPLSPNMRQQIVQLSREVYGNYQKSYKPLYDEATQRMKDQGIPKQFWNIPDPALLSKSVGDEAGSSDTPTGAKVLIDKDGNKFDASNLSDTEYQQAIKDGYTEQPADPGPLNSVGGDTQAASTVQIPEDSHLSYVNNNPGNLRFAGQAGATQGAGGFAKFSTPEAGFNALLRQIKLDTSRGLTLQQFISKFAPPSENDTAHYIQSMEQATGTPRTTSLSKIPIMTLAKAIANMESSSKIS